MEFARCRPLGSRRHGRQERGFCRPESMGTIVALQRSEIVAHQPEPPIISDVRSSFMPSIIVFRFLVLSAGLAAGFALSAQPAESPARLEALRVAGAPVPGENKIIGTYHQPEWTARRRFTLGSVYVQPEDQFEAELGWREARLSTQPNAREFNQELEIGLPHRLQLNLENGYRDFRDAESFRRWHHDGAGLGVRYALADWGTIPLNPAVGLGWRGNSGAPDTLSGQLLVATELSPRWHWGATLLREQRVGGLRTHETTLGSGLSFSVINESVSVGLEGKLSYRKDRTANSASTRRALGPSVQWRPVDQVHLDVAPLFGSGRGSARREWLVFVGFEFGDGADDGDEPRKKVEAAATRGR